MVKEWVEFVKYFDMLKLGEKYGLTDIKKVKSLNSSEINKANNTFMENIEQAIQDSRIFSVEDNTKKLLMLTKPPNKNDEIRLPFNTMFVDAVFTKSEIKELGWEIDRDICGFIIQEGVMTTTITNAPVGRTIRIIALLKNDEKFNFDTFSISYNIDEEFKDYKIEKVQFLDKKIKNFLHVFAINLLNLINDPEVEIVSRKEDVEQNNKRLSKGKCRIPDRTFIRLDAKRKQYVEKLVSGEKFTYSHAFFVRGHWMRFNSDRYKEKKGKKTWVLPYIKNPQAILVEKKYDI